MGIDAFEAHQIQQMIICTI